MLVGEPEKALDQLEPLVKMPYFLSPGWLKIDPNFDSLRKNPRFQKLVAGGKGSTCKAARGAKAISPRLLKTVNGRFASEPRPPTAIGVRGLWRETRPSGPSLEARPGSSFRLRNPR